MKATHKVLRALIRNRLGIPTPIIAIWCVTKVCNMQCFFCDHWEEPGNFSTTDMTTEQGLDLLKNLDKMGVGIINFGGGEPLLRKDIHLFVDEAKKKNIITHMNTNGYYLKEKAHLLKNMDYLRVSIDSTKTHDEIRGVKGAYDKAIEGIIEAKKYGIKTTIHSVITKTNMSQAEELCLLAQNLGVDIVFAKVFTKTSPYEKNDGKAFTSQAPSYAISSLEFNNLIKQLQKKYSCVKNFLPFLEYTTTKPIKNPHKKCATTSVAIRPDGTITLPCDKHPKVRINTLKKWSSAVKQVQKQGEDPF